MKKVTLLIFVLIGSLALANFPIKGEIANYESKPVLIKFYSNGQLRLLTKQMTDSKGKLNYQFPLDYKGALILEFARGGISLLADNSEINFTVDYDKIPQGEKAIFEPGINLDYQKYKEYENLNMLKSNYYPNLLGYYNEGDAFYKALKVEMERIENIKDITKNISPELNYYINTTNDLREENLKEEGLQKLEHHILNDGEELENFGFLTQISPTYLGLAMNGATSKEEAQNKIELVIDKLLDKVVVDTPRGQSVLLNIINILESNDFDSSANKYKKQATSLTCELTPEMQDYVNIANSIAIGKKAPDFKFDKQKGANSLYKVKAKKKILLFWSSTCPHCIHELPFVKEFYKNFKKEGGEIIAIALDLQKEDYMKLVEDVDWINFSDLKKWEGPISQMYGINSTPTYILLNEDNIIEKIQPGGSIAEMIEL